jgi:iron-regulated transporter 1
MWLFAIGLFMMKLYPESLKLTAIYGIVLAGSILVLGTFLGAWIDKTRRIHGEYNSIFITLYRYQTEKMDDP